MVGLCSKCANYRACVDGTLMLACFAEYILGNGSEQRGDDPLLRPDICFVVGCDDKLVPVLLQAESFDWHLLEALGTYNSHGERDSVAVDLAA